MDCIFCKIAEKKIPAHIIYENAHVIAFLDTSCDAEGHTLAVPKKHVENILDCPDEVMFELMRAVKIISNHYTEKCGYDGVNIINNSGESAHQSVFHLHIHIFPRRNNDGMDLTMHLPKKELDLKELCDKLSFSGMPQID